MTPVLPKLLTTNLAAVDPQRELLNIIGVLGRESRGRLQVSPLGRLRRVCSVVLPAFRDRAATPNPLSLDIDIDVNVDVDVQSVCPTE